MAEKKKEFFPVIEAEECKGCGRCVNACPKKVLEMGISLNAMGSAYAAYKGDGCIGCGACFYNCPEPGAITIIEKIEDDD
ncbi:MAG: ketoisovalerate oxidoreductase [Lentisphaerae bacterium GWF2_44_16]|nr:MAG: ketoisovalerate oxidoreductase [Lentisphaerae bacterium GWF2_44_16]